MCVAQYIVHSTVWLYVSIDWCAVTLCVVNQKLFVTLAFDLNLYRRRPEKYVHYIDRTTDAGCCKRRICESVERSCRGNIPVQLIGHDIQIGNENVFWELPRLPELIPVTQFCFIDLNVSTAAMFFLLYSMHQTFGESEWIGIYSKILRRGERTQPRKQKHNCVCIVSPTAAMTEKKNASWFTYGNSSKSCCSFPSVVIFMPLHATTNIYYCLCEL